jgi:hypothetical protein
VSGAYAPPEPPVGLGEAGRGLWVDVVEGDVVLRPDELAVLAEAAATRDVIVALAKATTDAPAMIEGSRGQVVVNPGLQELRQQRQLLASLLRQLGIPDPDDDDDWDGLTASQRARKAAGKRWGR